MKWNEIECERMYVYVCVHENDLKRIFRTIWETEIEIEWVNEKDKKILMKNKHRAYWTNNTVLTVLMFALSWCKPKNQFIPIESKHQYYTCMQSKIAVWCFCFMYMYYLIWNVVMMASHFQTFTVSPIVAFHFVSLRFV